MAKKTIVIIQSSYIPWKGYFDMINFADEFIIYDDVQYSKGSWRNRNQIKTANGLCWLTIPVQTLGRYPGISIDEVLVENNFWVKKHWHSIKSNYSKAPYFEIYSPIFQKIYNRCENLQFLSEINYLFISEICNLLEINTVISSSKDYGFSHLSSTDRLIEICKKAYATHYLSGPAAKDYLKEERFVESNIELSYMDYSDYGSYPQLFGEYQSNVSILDLLFNVGANSKNYMKSFLNPLTL